MTIRAPLGFLMRRKWGRKKLHIWTGADTACRMYSTGGMKPEGYERTPIINPEIEEICVLCASAEEKQKP